MGWKEINAAHQLQQEALSTNKHHTRTKCSAANICFFTGHVMPSQRHTVSFWRHLQCSLHSAFSGHLFAAKSTRVAWDIIPKSNMPSQCSQGMLFVSTVQHETLKMLEHLHLCTLGRSLIEFSLLIYFCQFITTLMIWKLYSEYKAAFCGRAPWHRQRHCKARLQRALSNLG